MDGSWPQTCSPFARPAKLAPCFVPCSAVKHGVSGPGKAENPMTRKEEIKDPKGDMSKNKGTLY